ncbi:hypothetical protein QQ045_017368 [Rhodiola kirilowii]
MMSPMIQKDIVRCFSQEVVCRIIEEIDNDVFALLVDESSDVSYKEQMAVILRFVDKSGTVKERFIGVIHVKDTSSASLKNAIDSLFSEHGLILKSVRGQGYDGASNMKVGDFFDKLSLLLNVFGASCKRRDTIRDKYQEQLKEAIGNFDIRTGSELNQELILQRHGNTR